MATASPLCSNKEDLMFFMKKWVLLDFALKYEFKKLLLGCSSLSVTSKTMSEIGKGRGLTLPHQLAFVDDRYLEDVKFMNPMRDFLQKEIAVYSMLNKVQIIPQKKMCLLPGNKKGKVLPGYGNLDMLSELFMTNL